ncbi:MAG: hypothetical protein M9916_10385 [Crocinitomicaceae bacterium]|nr:hypothetical protein [Crocinitomicaceae bacterium]
MRTLLVVIIAFLSLSVQFKNELRSVFGVRVSYQANGQMIMFIAYYTDDVMETNRKILSFDEFVHYASGDWPSIYNRNRMNLFELNDVQGGIYRDSITRKATPFCFAVDSLWKLRFSHYPFRGNNEMGWSQDQFLPSLSQQKYLYKQYGMTHIDTKFFVDTSFWKLLRDVTNQEWVENYKNIPLTD